MRRFGFLVVLLLVGHQVKAQNGCNVGEYCTPNVCDRGDTLKLQSSCHTGTAFGKCCEDNAISHGSVLCGQGEECVGYCSAQIVDHSDTRRCELNDGLGSLGKCCPMPNCPSHQECQNPRHCGDTLTPRQQCHLPGSSVNGVCCNKPPPSCLDDEECVPERNCPRLEYSFLPTCRYGRYSGVCCKTPVYN